VGDIVVFHPPEGANSNTCGQGAPPAGAACDAPTQDRADVNFIKRVVAGPGDRISIEDGHVILNGKRQKEDFARPCSPDDACSFPTEITIPADHYFMMGDNRGSSDDSRFWGPVPEKWIIGKAFATYWPPGRIGLL
jgi:signal peptidase I